MSCTSPAFAYWNNTPPPQVWKRSGGEPDCMTVVSFCLNDWFSRMVILIFTLGCAFMYWLARFCKNDLPGSVVWICHQLMVACPLVTPAPELPLPQAESNGGKNMATPATLIAARKSRRFIGSMLPSRYSKLSNNGQRTINVHKTITLSL